MVVGAGRGPLVRASLNAARITGRRVRVWAVEKNLNAVVHIGAMVASEGCVRPADMSSFHDAQLMPLALHLDRMWQGWRRLEYLQTSVRRCAPQGKHSAAQAPSLRCRQPWRG